MISSMCSLALGSWSGASTPRPRYASANLAPMRSASDSVDSPVSAAAAMILSSMSVMFLT